MFSLFAVVGLVLGVRELIKEQTTPVAPSNMRFDYDAYRADISKLSVKEQMKKVERGDYFTTK